MTITFQSIPAGLMIMTMVFFFGVGMLIGTYIGSYSSSSKNND